MRAGVLITEKDMETSPQVIDGVFDELGLYLAVAPSVVVHSVTVYSEARKIVIFELAEPPGSQYGRHCSIMFLFMMWTSSSHLTLNS